MGTFGFLKTKKIVLNFFKNRELDIFVKIIEVFLDYPFS